MVNKVVKKSFGLKEWLICFALTFFLQAEAWAEIREEAVRFRIRGYQLQYRGQLQEAISNYQKSIEADPTYAAPHNDLGIIYESKGWLDKAEQEFLETLRLDPNYLDAYFNLASLYERLGDKEKTIKYLRKRVELGTFDDVGTQEAQIKLDELLGQEASLVESAPSPSSPTPAPQKRPSFAEVPPPAVPAERETSLVDPAIELRNRGLGRQKAGELEEARALYEKALRVRPDFATVYNDLGILLEDQGKLEEARAFYQKALLLRPDYRLAKYNLALLYEREGNFSQAIERLEQFIASSPYNDPWARQAHARLGVLRRRLAHLEQVHLREEERVPNAALEEKRREEAQAILREQIRREFEEEEGRKRAQKIEELFEKGKKAYREKEEEEALEAFGEMLVLDPQNKVAQDYSQKIKKRQAETERQTLAARRREIDEGKQARRKEREKELSGLFESGKKAYRGKAYDEATHSFEKMLLVDPQLALAKEYLEKTKERVAEQQQKAIEEENKRLAQIQEKIAQEKQRKELEEKRRKEAEEQYDQAKLLFRDGKLPEALRLFEAFLIVQPDHPYATRYVERIREKQKEEQAQIASSLASGERLLKEGRYETAHQAFQTVATLDPHHPQAQEKLRLADQLWEKEKQVQRERKAQLKRERLETALRRRSERLRESAKRAYQEGLQLAKEGKNSEALAAFEQALVFDPAHEAAQQQMGRIQEKLAFEETAQWRVKKEDSYRKGFLKEETKLLYERSRAAFQGGDLLLAQKTLEYLLVIAPDHPYARADLEEVEEKFRQHRQGSALQKSSLKRETRRTLKTPLEPIEHAQRAPLSRPTLPRMQEEILAKPGDSEDPAHDLMRRVAKGYAAKGSSLQSMEEIDAAIAYYRKAQAIERSSQIANNLGILYERKGLLKEAQESYREALTLDPKFLAAHTNLALLYEKMGRLEEASKHWRMRIELGSPDDLWTQRARTHLDAQKIP